MFLNIYEDNKLTEVNDKSSIYFYYDPNTTQNAQRTVNFAVKTLVAKTNKNKDFFDNMTFYIMDDYKNTPKSSIFTKFIKRKADNIHTAGITINPVYNLNKKEIAINTNPTNWFIRQLHSPRFNNYRNSAELKEVTLHEIGHLFDAYFGEEPSSDVQAASENLINNTEVFDVLWEYICTSELSDSEEFKKAWRDDLEILAQRGDCKVLQDNLGYFSPEFFTNEIDITDGIDDKELNSSDKERSEVFAQAFAYALGSDSELFNKDLFKTVYKKSINLVKKYITKNLGINLDLMNAPLAYKN